MLKIHQHQMSSGFENSQPRDENQGLQWYWWEAASQDTVVKQSSILGFAAGRDSMAACAREVAARTNLTADVVMARQIQAASHGTACGGHQVANEDEVGRKGTTCEVWSFPAAAHGGAHDSKGDGRWLVDVV